MAPLKIVALAPNCVSLKQNKNIKHKRREKTERQKRGFGAKKNIKSGACDIYLRGRGASRQWRWLHKQIDVDLSIILNLWPYRRLKKLFPTGNPSIHHVPITEDHSVDIQNTNLLTISPSKMNLHKFGTKTCQRYPQNYRWFAHQ